MARAEFSKKVKNAAYERANKRCEGTGTFYGWEPGHRCNMPLDRGVEYDHIILEANSHDNSLTNCAAVCIPCHEYKTRKRDIPTAAKTVRQRDKDRSITSHKRSWPKRAFRPCVTQNTKYIENER